MPSTTTARCASAASPSERKRRPRRKGNTPRSYVLQRGERMELRDQVRSLRTQLELLKIRAGLSTLDDPNSVASHSAANAAVVDRIREQKLQLARFHSLVTRQLQLVPLRFTDSHIHLPKDATARRQALDSLKEWRLRRATEVALNRLRALDLSTSFKHQERSLTPDGRHQLHYLEVQHFRGLSSACQLFDALLFYRDHMEMCVSEQIGQLTLREDADQEHPTVWTARLVTTGELGGVEELNLVAFDKFFAPHGPLNGAPLGVMAMDTVDDDELYPYRTAERMHRISHGLYTVSQYHDRRANELVVVLTTDTTTTQLPPEFPLPPPAFDKAVENLPRWLGVMNKFLREFTRAP